VRFAVAQRELLLARDDRPLRTVVWFPATSTTIGSPMSVADGAFPLVIFSHGVRGTPESYQRIITAIASAGFVVAAPAYPNTNGAAARIEPLDVMNQPADASAVISAVLALNSAPGDPLEGHLDPNRVAAAGHSGGGFTTTGLLSHARDVRVRAAIVIAAGTLSPSFTGPPVPVLFVHGDADNVVRYSLGRGAFDQVPWPKAFLTVVDGDHGGYLYLASPATTAVENTVVDFLRATLYGDAEALARIPSMATVDDVTTFESAL
jgi:dienelactone hydrolase